MKRSFNFFSFILLIACSTATIVFISCSKNDDLNNSSTADKSVVINGVHWATCNVDKPGTFVAGPEDAGMFYQWDIKIGWSSTDPMTNTMGGTTWNNSSANVYSHYYWSDGNDYYGLTTGCSVRPVATK